MHAPQMSHDARQFQRGEAFAEDVADLIERSTFIAAARRRTRPSRLWLLSPLPIGTAAGLAVAVLQRLMH